MIYCSKCGNSLEDNATVCEKCGTSTQSQTTVQGYSQPVTHDVPRCTCCGNVGEMKYGPLFTFKDIFIGAILTCLGFVPGIIYFTIHIIRYGNKRNREKICTKCGAKNMFTYLY